MDGTEAFCVGLGVEKEVYVEDLASGAFVEDILISGSLLIDKAL